MLGMRRSGLEVLGEIPWSTHLCQFYQTSDDLVDILVPFLGAGLRDNEFCAWVTSGALRTEQAIAALRVLVPNVDEYLRTGQLEVFPYDEWYVREGAFDSRRVLDSWSEKLERALERGFDGARVTGDTMWLEKKDWKDFMAYESAINEVIRGRNLIVLCTYSLPRCSAAEVLDVVNTHEFALVRKEGAWEMIESQEQKRAAEALKRHAERLDIISSTAGALLACNEPQQVVEALCRRVMEHLDCHAFFNFLVDEERDRLYLNAYAGIPEETARDLHFLDFGVAVCGCAARDATRIVAEHIPTTPDIRTELVKSFGIKAYACHPLLAEGKVIGTLSFGTKSRLTFTEDELSLMKTVADQVATAMERIRLLRATRERADELEVRVRERTAQLEQAREKLIEQSRILEGFFTSTVTPLVLLDRDFNFVRVNEAYATCCGREIADFEGHNHFEFYPHPENEAIFRNVVETKKPREAVAKAFTFSDHPEWGTTYWNWTLTPLFDDADEVEFLVFSLQDVTEHRRAEEAVRAAGIYNRNLIEAAIDPFVTIDRDGRISDVNSATERTTGYSREELIGSDFSDYFTEPARAREGYLHVFDEGFVRDYELELRHRDGQTIPVLYNASVFRNEAGEVIGVFAAARDVSDLRRAEQQLRQAQKMEALGTLAGGIAHDFNNILAAIIGFSEMLRDRVPEGSRERRQATRIMDAGVRGRELVRQMLTFSRQTEQEKKPLRLSSIVNETVQLLRPSIPTTIDIAVNIESESGMVLGDPVQIQQVLMNLATNAAHAMREKGGLLEIDLSDFSVPASHKTPHGIEPGLYMRLLVRDTGQGMTPDVVEKVFDPFFTTKRTGEGTGLGLSVVMGIVRQCHGSITVESQPGKGSTFAVYFPTTAEEPTAEREQSDEAVPTGKERILLVDDEEAIVEMGEEILTELGYEVTCQTSSRDALSLVRTDPSRFDLVITDQTMPDISGIELAREVLTLRPNMPMILCTGFSHLVDADMAKSAGIRAFAMKPLTKKEIAGTIRNVLDG